MHTVYQTAVEVQYALQKTLAHTTIVKQLCKMVCTVWESFMNACSGRDLVIYTYSKSRITCNDIYPEFKKLFAKS